MRAASKAVPTPDELSPAEWLTPDENLNHWKRLIRLGNRCFAEGHGEEALARYQLALGVSLILFESCPDDAVQADAIVATVVITRHNLADLYLQRGDTQLAAQYLCAAHLQLAQAMASAHAHGALCQAAWQHSRHTRMELLAFASRHARYAELVGQVLDSGQGVMSGAQFGGH